MRHFTTIFVTAISTATISMACTTSTLSAPTPGAAKCQVTASGPETAIAAIGGGGTVVVSAQPECPWSISTEASWITDVSPAKGQGTANVQFTAAPNPVPTPRQADIAVSGVPVHVNQDAAPCSFDVKPQAVTVGFVGGNESVTVTTLAGCMWTALSQVDWVTVTSSKDNNGAQTVTFDVAANAATAARTGSITVAGQPITVSQSGRNCTYSINRPTMNFTSAGGTGSVSVTTLNGCTWTAASNATWIAVSSGATGNGPGSVAFSVNANVGGGARTAAITIAGQILTVTQDAGCSYSINPTSQSLRDPAGTGTTVAVTTQTSCGWTAVSNASWITVNSGSVNGNGSVGWTYTANTMPGISRTGTMTIAGQTFTVVQAGPCTYSVAPVGQTVSDLGGAGTPITVTTQAGCSWTAASRDSWITVTSGATGTGSGQVQISLTRNVVYGARAGTLVIGGQVATVIQNGVPGVARSVIGALDQGTNACDPITATISDTSRSPPRRLAIVCTRALGHPLFPRVGFSSSRGT